MNNFYFLTFERFLSCTAVCLQNPVQKKVTWLHNIYIGYMESCRILKSICKTDY